MNPLIIADKNYLAPFLNIRDGEVKMGQKISLLATTYPDELSANLNKLKQNGVRFVLLGIPEDIGPRANLGKGGADKGWQAFLARFCSLQHNKFLNGAEITLLGHINCEDLQHDSTHLDTSNTDELAVLRTLVEQLDERVYSVCKIIFSMGLFPIVIGGGHNNAYPIIKAASSCYNSSIAAVNFDPHSDFRNQEGRHSGNGFNYAASQGYLSHYFSLGLHEYKNSEENLNSLITAKFPWISYQQIWSRREISFEMALKSAENYLINSKLPIGVELDLDCISYVPASAYTNCGVTIQDAEYYVYSMASLPTSCYLHLAEGAPSQHSSGLQAGMSDVGQTYSALVANFIQAKQVSNGCVKWLLKLESIS